MLAFIRIPPSIASAFVQVDENVGARVTPRHRDPRVLDGLEILVLFRLGAGCYVVVAASHGGIDTTAERNDGEEKIERRREAARSQ